MGKLDGRVALVTGAASGLGRASAQLFAAEGAIVVFADLNEDGAQAGAEGVIAAGGQAHAAQLDVTSADDCQRVINDAVAQLGRLDILMTCAGLGESAPLDELDVETFDRVYSVNVRGTFLCAKYAFPALARQGGSIIALGSIAGIIASPGFASYATSKAAVIHLARVLAAEGASRNIRVNTICPSWIWTPMVEKAMEKLIPGAPADKVQQYLARQTPMGRMGTPEDVARAALYLASDESAFMTGQALVLDGGTTLGPQPA